MLALVGCDGPTQLLVIVDSDVGDALAVVEVAASSEGALATTRRFELATTGLPFSFGVVPARDAGAVHLHAVGLARDGAPLLSHTVETEFVRGHTLRLELPLARACLTEPGCAERDLRCVYGACVERHVDPATLAEGDGAPEGLFDGATALPDAGPGPVIDAGCGAPCHDPASPCRIGRTRCEPDALRCELTETLPEGAPCGDGRACDAAGRCGAGS